MSSTADKPKDSKPKPATTSSPEKPLPPGWTKLPSKKRPGLYYYFNATTNTSMWNHPARALAEEAKIVANVTTKTSRKVPSRTTASAEEKLVQLRNDSQFKKPKNMAKQRMDTLRTKLEEERKEGKLVTKKGESPKRKPEVKATMASQKPEVKPSTPKEKTAVKVATSKQKPEVKPVASPKKTVDKKQEVVKKTSSPRLKRKHSVESPKRTAKKSAESPKTSAKSHAIKKTPPKADALFKKKVESLKPFKIPKKPPEEPVSSPIFVDIRKLEESKPPPVPVSTPKTVTPIAPIDSPKTPSEAPRCESTPKVVRESYIKSPANDRLAHLRDQLAQNVPLDEDTEMTDLSVEAIEQMDWEDIPEEIALREVVTIRQSLGLKLSGVDSVLNTSIPDNWTNLNDQLNSFQRFFFVVVDTNIFLSHLKQLEQILANGFPVAGQPILIIPYMVLQELDRIKHREAGLPLSQAACRSIRFLNNFLKLRDPRVKGQSSIEAAATPIIPIENPDDHIMNCCLQVGRNIAGQPTELLLLSNDVNLRNKALVNGLTALSFVELTAEAEKMRKAAG